MMPIRAWMLVLIAFASCLAWTPGGGGPVPLGASAPCGSVAPEPYEVGWDVGDGSATLESGDGKQASVFVGFPAAINSSTLYTKGHRLSVAEGYYRVTVHIVSSATANLTGGEVVLLHGGVEVSSPRLYEVPHNEQGGLRSLVFADVLDSDVLITSDFGVGVRVFAANKIGRAVSVDYISVAVERISD